MGRESRLELELADLLDAAAMLRTADVSPSYETGRRAGQGVGIRMTAAGTKPWRDSTAANGSNRCIGDVRINGSKDRTGSEPATSRRLDRLGSSESVTVANWYLGAERHVEVCQLADGRQLLDSQVQSLVQAMAAFSPPAAGQTSLPESYAGTLNPVIAANWQ